MAGDSIGNRTETEVDVDIDGSVQEELLEEVDTEDIDARTTQPITDTAATIEDDDTGFDIDAALDFEEQIFERYELVDADYIPDKEYIVGRDDELREVVGHLRTITKGARPADLLLYGRSGTGKSLVAKTVADKLEGACQRNEIRFGYAYIDCAQTSTEAKAIAHVARALNDQSVTGLTIPDTGVARSWLYNRLWEIIDIQYDSVLVILDEIDKLNGRDGTDDTNVLFQLSRSKESNKTETKLGVVCISNDIHYSEDFGAAVHSSYEPEKIVFSAYDANELRDILHKRADAFKPGVLNDEVLPLSAALAAQEHGDARRAITILRKAGRLASRQDDPRVTTQHVHAAADYADADRVQELLRGTPIQPKLTILALAALCTQSDSQVHTSPTIYRMYLNLIQMVDANRLSQRRVTDFLKEHRDNGLLELERTGGGPGEGSYYECHLTEKEDIVFETLLEDDRLSELEQAEIAKVAFQIDL